MYRVVIVDDEPWALLGIQRLLEGKSNRFRIICQTTEPQEALKVILKERPDVVFTDIRMPEISGIDLMRKVRISGIESVFIVVSGFAEFSFAQQALQEGALDYQLKPLDMGKTEEMLEKLYKHLENKRSTDDLNFFTSFVEEGSSRLELLKTRFRGPLYRRYQSVTVYFKDYEYDMHLFDTEDKIQYIALKLGPKKVAFIINSHEELGDFIIRKLSEKGVEVEKAGISSSTVSPDQLPSLLKASDTACNDCFVDNSRKISHYKKPKLNLAKEYADKIVEALHHGDSYRLQEVTSGMKAFFLARNMGIEEVVFLWNQIAAGTMITKNHYRETMDIEFLDYREIVEKFLNLEALSEYLIELLSCFESHESGNANENFKNLLEYINKHYQDELFLKDLSNRFYINTSYCSELFKKHTGMTFSQYTTDVRIKKACELMKNSALAITDICESVGFGDYFYFNKVFKKYTGCTPAKYRKMIGNNSD